MKPYEKFVSKESVKKIHENTVRILEDTGVIFENERAIDIFRQHGAKIDGSKVFISRKMLDECLKTVPGQFTLRDDSGDLVTMSQVSKDRIVSAVGGNIYIEENGKVRKTNNQDTVNQFKMNTASPIVSTAGFNQFPDRSSWTDEQKICGSLAMQLRYSDKYHFSAALNFRGLPKDLAQKYGTAGYDLLRNFKGITGSEDYYCVTSINALSPLTYDHDPVENILRTCEQNQPLLIASCAMPLLTAPASLAGLLSTTNAEVLSGMVLSQLARPGLPFLYGNVSGSTNMRHIQLSIGSPEAALTAYAAAGLADLYGLPFRNGGSLCDAKDMDAQAGAEAMMMIYATLDSGASYIMHIAGTMGAYNIVSFEKFILDEEIMSMVQRQLRGINCEDEYLLYDEIKDVGPRGTFLRGRTPKMFREEFMSSKLFNKDDPNNWQNSGAVTIKQAAAEEVKKRIESYSVPERTKDQLDLLRPYMPQAYKDTL